MRLSTVALLMIVTTVMLASCAQEQQAAVENKGGEFYGKSFASRIAYKPYSNVTEISATEPEAAAKTSAAPGENKLQYVPFATRWHWPVSGKVIQNFGPQRDGIASEGISIAAAEGEPIRAAQGGEVAYVGNNIRDYGNMVILRHQDGTLSSYSHARAITVAKGQQVKGGSVIGFVGQSGSAKTPQLHFAVREGSKAVDPLTKLSQDMANNQ